jgi:hypothetical protein
MVITERDYCTTVCIITEISCQYIFLAVPIALQSTQEMETVTINSSRRFGIHDFQSTPWYAKGPKGA